ncbi:hypothetical protein ACSMXM_00020 [Pacificimonas sp. ICDLI1SI03]
MLAKASLQRMLTSSILLFLCTTLFMYPYGIAITGENYLRVPDFFALTSLIIGTSIIILRKRIYRYPALEIIILPFAFCEIIYPLLSVFGLGAGLAEFSNSLRMMLLWLPPLFLLWTTPPERFPTFDTAVAKLFRIALVANFIYGFIQMLYYIGLLPKFFVITYLLEPFAVDSHFRIINNIRASGFFVNTTGLAAFAMLCESYFFARFIVRKENKDLYFGALAAMIAIMTLSRAAMAGTVAVMFFLWLTLKLKQKITVPIIIFFASTIFLMLMDEYIGIDRLFYRYEVFMQLGIGGALSDSSFSLRLYEFWPQILARLQNYPFGTLSSPGDKLGLIDSGYLTYYAQGRLLFLGTAVFAIIGMLAISWPAFLRRRNEGAIQLGFIALYLIGAMVISIPTRYSFIVFFIVYSFWNYQYHLLSVRLNTAVHKQKLIA